MVFPVVMYGCESWTIKKAECWRIDAFELWCWRLLKSPLDRRRSNQLILKEISPEYSLEGLMLKLKRQYFGHLMQRGNSLEKILMLQKIEDEEKGMTEDEMVRCHHRLNGHEFEQTSGDSAAVHGVAKSQTWLSSWTRTRAKVMGIFMGEWGGSGEQAGTPTEHLFIHWCLSREASF